MDQNENNRPMKQWEDAFFGVRVGRIPHLFPGLMAVIILAIMSIWLSEFIGVDLLGFNKSPVSAVMIALLLGIAIGSTIGLPKLFDAGLKFSVKKLLRLGIILLGIRLTIFDVFKLGAFGVPIVILCIVGAFLITTWINKKLALPRKLGTLIAVGTSICGVTAIVAASPVIDADEEESAYAVAVITVFGLFATLVYPYLANYIFSGDALKVGLFLGTAIHETAQVVGAAKIYADMFSQPLSLDIATVAKLVRNVFMAFVIPFIAYYYAREIPADELNVKKTGVLKLLPAFILGFIAMAAIRSLGDAGIKSGSSAFGLMSAQTWAFAIDLIKSWAEVLLVIALAGVGLATNFRSIKKLGSKPFLVGLGASLAVGLVSYLAIRLLGGLVTY